MVSKRLRKRRAKTAERRRKKINTDFLGNSVVTPHYDPNLSPINESLYLSRKISYERLFDKPENKDNIKIVGQNIQKCVDKYEIKTNFNSKNNTIISGERVQEDKFQNK